MLVIQKQQQILVHVIHALNFTNMSSSFITEFICYDDVCHLKHFVRNPVRAGLTPYAQQLASVEMAVDKMHMKGHTDPWCKTNCDPSNFLSLREVKIYIIIVCDLCL